MSKRLLYACLLLWLLPACSDPDREGPWEGGAPLGGGPSGVVVDAGGDATAPAPGSDAGSPSAVGDAGPSAAPLDAAARADTSVPTPSNDSGAAATPEASVAVDASQSDAATGGACDRACLLGVMQGYLDALIAHDASKLKVAANLKYTDNGVAAKLGDGLWKSATALVKEARLDFADPSAGQVTTQTVVNEGSSPVIYMARLKVVAGEITEIESMSVRRQGAANGFFDPTKLVPEKAFLAPVDPAKRMSRDALNKVTELYLDYLEGKKRAQELPFDNGCKRYENGQVTASGVSGFNGQNFWSFHVTRRTLIIDEEAGITWGMYPFEQDASALVVGEAFKIVEGKIMMIQAVMARMPAKAWQ
ncbi:MAG TPA: hypothetical protein VJU61_25755 [Polyangiaceae bacterium]|nr:hypothetical protein [Polyangiaceae bacterium]